VYSTLSGTTDISTGELAQLTLTVLTNFYYILFSVSHGDATLPVYYVLKDTTQMLSKAYSNNGMYTVTVVAVNGSVPLNHSLTFNVTGGPSCAPPTVSIANPGTSNGPVPLNRSTMIILTGELTLSCTYTYTVTKLWTMTRVYPTVAVIDMTSDPNSAFSGYDQGILVVRPNTLNYGVYMFNYSVTISFSAGSFLQWANTYVSVVATGLNVFGFPSGILQQAYGSA
jgi:hypothetical protein